MDRLRAIEVFTEVARGRSFSAAATRLGMARGNITKTVSWLEETMGAQLLTRTTRSVNLTENGRRLLEQGQDLLDRFELMAEDVRAGVREPRGVIRIGTPPSFGAVHLVPLICDFVASHRRIQFAMHLDDGSADIAEEGLDLSLRIAPSLRDTSLVGVKLGSVPQMLVASPDYLARRGTPQAPHDLADHDCLVNALKSPTNVWALTAPGGQRESVRVGGALRSNFGESLRQAAVLGAGISMHPNYMVAQDLEQRRLVVVLPQWRAPGLEVFAMYPHRRNVPGRLRLFIDFLKARFLEKTEWQVQES